MEFDDGASERINQLLHFEVGKINHTDVTTPLSLMRLNHKKQETHADEVILS